MATYPVSSFITDIRTLTNHDTDQQITDDQIRLLCDPVVQSVQRKIADIVPDMYTAVTADFTIAAGASSQDLTASPLSLSNIGKIRTVERKDGSIYYPLPLVPVQYGSHPGRLSWRQRGETIVDISPADQAPGTYRIKYLTRPPILASAATQVVLPHGADSVIVATVSAQVEMRLRRDPSPYLAMAKQAWNDLEGWLLRMYPSAAIPIADVTGRF